MPVLKTYTATIGPAPAAGGRRASAEDFGASAGLAGAGKSLQDFGEKVLDQKEQEESRKALITSTELRARYMRELDEISISGGDPATLKEKMAADYARIGEDFVTKRGTESVAYYAANSEIGFDEQANRIEVQRARANAQLDTQKLLNSGAAILQSDPNALAGLVADGKAYIATYPKLSKEQITEFGTEFEHKLNLSAALSAVRINPQQALADMEAGRWNLRAPDFETVRGHADQEIRARRTQEAVQEARAEKQKRERSEKAWDRHIQALDAGAFSASAVARDPDMEPQQKIAMQNFATTHARALVEQEKPSNPAVKSELFLRAIALDTDERKLRNDLDIVEAANRRDLNIADTMMLRRIVAEQRDSANVTIGNKTNHLLAAMESALRASPKYQAMPEKVVEIMWTFRELVMERAEEKRAKGENPNDIFSPKDPKFVGDEGTFKMVIAQVEGRAAAMKGEGLPQMPEDIGAAKRLLATLKPGDWYRDVDGSTAQVPEGAAVPKEPQREPFEPPRPVEAVGRAVGGVVRRLQEATPREGPPPIRRRPERLPGED